MNFEQLLQLLHMIEASLCHMVTSEPSDGDRTIVTILWNVEVKKLDEYNS
jgi:hypothetical protein